jgi:hypothetical protein
MVDCIINRILIMGKVNIIRNLLLYPYELYEEVMKVTEVSIMNKNNLDGCVE